jgi:hypothetical protein
MIVEDVAKGSGGPIDALQERIFFALKECISGRRLGVRPCFFTLRTAVDGDVAVLNAAGADVCYQKFLQNAILRMAVMCTSTPLQLTENVQSDWTVETDLSCSLQLEGIASDSLPSSFTADIGTNPVYSSCEAKLKIKSKVFRATVKAHAVDVP